MRRWEENNEETIRKWEENNEKRMRRWEENNEKTMRRWEENGKKMGKNTEIICTGGKKVVSLRPNLNVQPIKLYHYEKNFSFLSCNH